VNSSDKLSDLDIASRLPWQFTYFDGFNFLI